MNTHGLRDAVVSTVCRNWREAGGDAERVRLGTRDERVLALIADIAAAPDPLAYCTELEIAARP